MTELFDKKRDIQEIDIEDEMRQSYIEYAMSTIVGRALPDVRDGLKPVHRRIFYAMNESGYVYNKPYKKSARIVGDVMGKYHPHGDSAIYNTLVRMAQDFSMRNLLIDGQGNFGSIDGDSPAAMRYTESRMSKLASELVADIDKDTVDFVPNYDNSLQEPVILPAKFPNLLVNGSSGIAVGMATNIPPHNLKEITQAIVHLIDNPNATVEDLMEYVPGPDFPTGAFITGRSGIRKAYKTGRGKITLRARAYIENDSIIITEIPYQVNKSTLLMKIASLVRKDRIDGISDIRDESDRTGMRINIMIKRNAEPQVVLNKLYKLTQLETTFGIIMIALKDGEPIVMNLPEMMKAFIEHRRVVIIRRTIYDLNKAKAKAHILEGLKKAIDNIDLVIKIIRGSDNTQNAKTRLMTELELSEKQSKAILDMRLARLTALERDKLIQELEETLKLIEELEGILASAHKIREIIKEELIAISDEFSDKRRTKIIDIQDELTAEDLIADEMMIVSISRKGYIKRTSISYYRAQRRGGIGISGMKTKDEDFVSELFVASNHDTLLFITEKGMAYSLKVYEIPEAGRNAKGMAIVNLLRMSKSDSITSIMSLRDFDDNRSIVFVTENGISKKTMLSDFAYVKRTGIIAIKLKKGDKLISARLIEGEEYIYIATYMGMTIRFSSELLRAMGRTAQGVIGIRLRPDDRVVGVAVPQYEDKTLLFVTEKGYAKRTYVSEYREQNRGGKGMIGIRISPKNGGLVGIRTVDPDDEIVVITSEGVLLRTKVDSISIIGRATQGVRLIRLREGQRVTGIAKVPKAEKEDEKSLFESKETNDSEETPGIDEENNLGDNAKAEESEKEEIDKEDTANQGLFESDEE
ncbi:MAG: DNA gyrase subunit A [Candidatus Zixiibacteriota bacterium]